MLELVKLQHDHFGLTYNGKPRHLDTEEKYFYALAMAEEIDEYLLANNLEDEYDAILDLLVFALGAMLRHGFDPKGIVEVVKANLQKEVGPLEKRGGFKLDLKKPADWQPPNLKEYL